MISHSPEVHGRSYQCTLIIYLSQISKYIWSFLRFDLEYIIWFSLGNINGINGFNNYLLLYTHIYSLGLSFSKPCTAKLYTQPACLILYLNLKCIISKTELIILIYITLPVYQQTDMAKKIKYTNQKSGNHLWPCLFLSNFSQYCWWAACWWITWRYYFTKVFLMSLLLWYIYYKSNPERWCCESAALYMPANLENSAVAQE